MVPAGSTPALTTLASMIHFILPPRRFIPKARRLRVLVLSRKKNEEIIINNEIIVRVVEIRGDKVRLGIVAPKDVPVHRSEVQEVIHRNDPKRGA